MEFIDNFHFLRPWALALIPLLVLMVFFAQRQLNSQSAWKQWIDPQLLPQMLVQDEGKQWRFPWWLAALVLSAGAVGLAGPSWEKLPQPVIQKQNALVVILDLSPSMNSQDIKPSRLAISRFKLIDLLKQRKEGQTGLVVYAGEAHVVTPLTDDVETIINLLPVLKPSLMPIRGSNVEAGIAQSIQLLKDSGLQSGDILLLSDGVAEQALGNIEDQLSGKGYRLSVMSIGTATGGPIPSGQGFMKDSQGNIVIAKTDSGTLLELAQENGGLYVPLQAGEQDLERLNQFWQQDLNADDAVDPEDAIGDREFDQWQDNGHWFALALLLLFPFAFRRGGLLALVPAFILGTALSGLPASQAIAQTAKQPTAETGQTAPLKSPEQPSALGNFWDGLWQTPNQRGMEAYKQQDYQRARELFEDPQWQASSDYESGDFEAAAKAFAEQQSRQGESAQGQYNLGNALAQSGDIDGAIKAYDKALSKEPEHEDAKFNRELMEKLKQQQEQQQNNQDQQSQDNQEQENQEQGDSEQQQDQSGEQENQDQQQDQNNSDQQNDSEEQEQDPQSQEQDQQQDQEEQNQQDKEQQAEEQEGTENEQEQNPEQQAQAEINPDDLSDEEKQALEQWLKQVPDDPSGLLRRKFLHQQRQKQIAYRNGQLELPDNDAHKRY